jgi:hypothetical protein
LGLEIDPPGLNLMNPRVYAWSRGRILFGDVAKLHQGLTMFETFEMQQFDNVTLLEFRRSGMFCLSTIFAPCFRLFFRGNLKFS